MSVCAAKKKKLTKLTFAEPWQTFTFASSVTAGCAEQSPPDSPSLPATAKPTGSDPAPTHCTISDERVAQLGDFIPRERHFGQEDLPALDHDFFALGVVLEERGGWFERPELRQSGGAERSLPSTPGT